MVFRVSPAALLIACSSCDAAGLLGNDDDRHSSDQHQKQMSLGQKLDKILGLDSYSSATMEKILADINKNKNKQCCGTCTSTTTSSSSIVGLSQQDDKKDENRNPEEEDLSNRNDNIMDADTDTPRDSPLTSDVAMILRDLQDEEKTLSSSSSNGDDPKNKGDEPKNNPPVSVSSSCKTIALDVPREQMLSVAQSLSSVGDLDRTMTMDELSAAWLKDALSSLKEFVDHNDDQQKQQQRQKETPPRTELPMPKNLVARGGTEAAEVELVPPPIVTSQQAEIGAADADTGRSSVSPMLLPTPVASPYATPIRTNKAIKSSSAAADVSPASVTISSFTTNTNTTEKSSSLVIVEVPPPAPVRLSVNKAPFMPSPGGSPPTSFSDNVFDPFAVAVVSPTEGPAASSEQWKGDKDKDKDPPKFSVDLFETGEI